MRPTVADEEAVGYDQAGLLRATTVTAGIDRARLWPPFVSIGGDVSEFEADAYLHHSLLLPRLQRDLLAQAAHEILAETTPPRAPYASDVLSRRAFPGEHVRPRAQSCPAQDADAMDRDHPGAPDGQGHRRPRGRDHDRSHSRPAPRPAAHAGRDRRQENIMSDRGTAGLPVAKLQELLLETEGITDFLDEFTATLARALSTDGDEVWCAVTLLRPKKSTTVAASDARAEALDEIQYHYGDGPCLTAAREHRVVHVADTRTDPRWPEYGKAAAANGILSALGVPFELGGEATAGLDVYADRAHKYDRATIEVVQRQVLAVSTTLRMAVRLSRHRDTEADLRAALESRTTIDLAVGIVMGQNRCSQEKAFDILRAASSHRNVKLRDLAADLVATVGDGPAATHFND